MKRLVSADTSIKHIRTLDVRRGQGEITMNRRTKRLLTVVAISLVMALGLVTVGVVAPAGQAQASALVRLSDDQLNQAAAEVVAGEIISTHARWGDQGGSRGFIETVIELRVLRALKGAPESPGDTMTIVVPGGTMGDLTLVVDYAPVFHSGETAMLYLDDDGRVVGGDQGKRALSLLQAALYAATPIDAAFAAAEGATTLVDVSAATTPTITAINPPSGSAGTGTQVTISGAGFGATQGAGHVDFFYRSGQATMQAPISSWSDTAIVCFVPTASMGGYPGSAGSGPVTVTDANGVTSAGYDFHVTFGYGGYHWAAPSCSYRVNANTADTGSVDALVDAGALAWNAPSAFKFVDAGSSAVTTWDYNGTSEIFWTYNLPTGVLAAAYTVFSGSTILETDIGFNDVYAWGAGSVGTYDIQSIATHELGHTLNLRDLYGASDSAKVMYGLGTAGQSKRTLDADDVAGIQWIYGGGDPVVPVGKVTLTTSVAGSGSITRSPDQAQFDQGSSVTLSAVPASGWVFTGWGGGAGGSTNPLTVVMDSSKSITATFAVESAPPPSAAIRYEQTDPKLYYAGTWTSSSGTSYSGGNYKYANASGASVTVAFDGTSVGYVAKTASTLGRAKVTLDGGTPISVNLYSSTTKYNQKVWSVSGLAPGTHTLVIAWTGTRGGGTGTTINLDALDITGTLLTAPRPLVLTRYEQTDSKLRYVGTWTSSSGTSYSGRSYRYTNAVGASVTAVFSGTAVSFIAKKGSTLGVARIILDGGTPIDVNLYSATTRYKQKVWSISGLTAGNHTLVIEWTGTRGGGTGATINLDALDVLGTLITPTL
jgi:hypothetical protein